MNSKIIWRFSKETMEEALKSIRIGLKIHARMSSALCSLLFATEEEGKKLAESTPATKSVRLETEYFETRRTKVAVHGAPVDIS